MHALNEASLKSLETEIANKKARARLQKIIQHLGLGADDLRQYQKFRIQKNPIANRDNIVNFARKIVLAIRLGQAESQFSHDNKIDTSIPRYEVNCTGFINYVMTSQHPSGMEEIKNYIRLTHDYKGYSNGLPRCLQYYRFFKDSKHLKKHWESIYNAQHLRPGDIIVSCENIEKVTKGGQHIMMVAKPPKPSKEMGWLICPIYDSSRGGHGPNDLRGSGIEEGEIAIMLNNSGKLTGLKWFPESEIVRSYNFAMARVK